MKRNTMKLVALLLVLVSFTAITFAAVAGTHTAKASAKGSSSTAAVTTVTVVEPEKKEEAKAEETSETEDTASEKIEEKGEEQSADRKEDGAEEQIVPTQPISEAKTESAVQTPVPAPTPAPAPTPSPTPTPAPAPAPKPAEPETAPQGLTAAQLQIINNRALAQINALRTSTGACSLSFNGTLNNVAAVRAQEASQLWSHTRPNGTRGIDMLDATKYRGENLAKTYAAAGFTGTDAELTAIADRLVNNWINSSGHYANLVKGQYNIVGIQTYAVEQDGTYVFYTAAMFSNK